MSLLFGSSYVQEEPLFYVIGWGLAPAVRVVEFGVVMTLRFAKLAFFPQMAYNVIRLSNRSKGELLFLFRKRN